MPRGGSRPGAGRKAGTVSEQTKRRLETAERAAAEGVTPLEVMLTTMRSLWKLATDESGNVIDTDNALAANTVAKDAAPFIHPKLATVNATVDHSGVLDIRRWMLGADE